MLPEQRIPVIEALSPPQKAVSLLELESKLLFERVIGLMFSLRKPIRHGFGDELIVLQILFSLTMYSYSTQPPFIQRLPLFTSITYIPI